MKNKIVLYTTHCPMCLFLEKVLKDKKIEYEEVNDVDEMIKLGITSVPVLKVNEKLLSTKEALAFVNKL